MYVSFAYGAGVFMYFEGIELRKQQEIAKWIPSVVLITSPLMLPYFLYMAIKKARK